MNQHERRYFEQNGFQPEKSEYRKIHRINQSIHYLEECIRYKVLPKFAIIGKSATRSFSLQEIDAAQHKKVREALQNQKISFLNAENTFNNLFSTLRPNFKT